MLKDIIKNITKKDPCMDNIKEFMKLIKATDDDLLLLERPIKDEPLIDSYLFIGTDLPRNKLKQIVDNFDFMKDDCLINDVSALPVSFINNSDYKEVRDFYDELGKKNVILISFIKTPPSVEKYF